MPKVIICEVVFIKVIVTGGGTAGHINPALAIADKIKKENPNAKILFVGAVGKMESALVPKAGYDIKTIEIMGFQRKITLKNIAKNVSALFYVAMSGGKCKKIIKDFGPDAVIGTGGYVCGPVLRTATKMGIPTLVHESNAFPGLTVKMLAKHVNVVLLGEAAAKKHLPKETKTIVTGNPVSRDFFCNNKAKARVKLGLDQRPVVLSFGGSLGAKYINDVIFKILEKSFASKKLQHIHATGESEWNEISSKAKKAGLCKENGFDIRKYISDMPTCMAAADLIISRCGAMSVSEIKASGKASILIPSPNVAENHQYYNALALQQKNAAICIEEKDLNADVLWEKICEVTTDKDRLDKMGRNASKMSVKDADDRIYDAIMQVLHKK